MVPEPGNPSDINRYSYVRNNPLRNVDPTGHTTIPHRGPMIEGLWSTPSSYRRDPQIHGNAVIKAEWKIFLKKQNNTSNNPPERTKTTYEVKTDICGSQHYDPSLCTSYQHPYYGAQGRIINGPVENTGFGVRLEYTEKVGPVGVDVNMDLIYHFSEQQLDLMVFAGIEGGGVGNAPTGGVLLVQHTESNDELIDEKWSINVTHHGGTGPIHLLPGIVGSIEYSDNPNTPNGPGVWYFGIGPGGEVGIVTGAFSRLVFHHRIFGK
jgi:hypothetical protein